MKNIIKKTLLTGSLIALFSFESAKEKITLFDKPNPKLWYTFHEKGGLNNDTGKVFSYENGALQVSGKEFAYIATQSEYSNYRLTLEFKWGIKKYPPRQNEKRDAGIIYHFPLSVSDKIWPKGVEYQIQETDCGDFWIIGDITLKTKGEQKSEYGFNHIVKFTNAEKPSGEWNKVEIVTLNGKCTHYLNGILVNEATNVSINSGRILLQSEGAEVYYRNVILEKL
ncbi:MAG: DUF1080 domain-containing protein [Bacteroidota bacterium]|nr:DUF1080 domain-containing protein [Bacteroidota bacterium]